VLINDEYFRSNDLALVTALSLDFKILGTEKKDDSRIIFLFENNADLSAYVARYWRGEIFINPIKYFNQIKVIKTRIYSLI
jgi:hypothetical protein